jgi:crotonobetainyl-CoA:carnitine CoA-transferase CaiB-like acyl-CoA transferase
LKKMAYPMRRLQNLKIYSTIRDLLATGGIATIEIPTGIKAGSTTKTPLLPLTIGGQRLGVRLHPPYQGAHTKEILAELGLSAATIEELIQKGITIARD